MRPRSEDVTETETNEPGVPIDDWSVVCRRLRVWCERAGTYRETERNGVDCATCEFGGPTRFAVTRDGRVDTGMPLHEFEGVARRLAFTENAVRVIGDDVAYTFRRP